MKTWRGGNGDASSRSRSPRSKRTSTERAIACASMTVRVIQSSAARKTEDDCQTPSRSAAVRGVDAAVEGTSAPNNGTMQRVQRDEAMP